MSTYIFPLNECGIPAGVLRGKYLYESHQMAVIACTDGNNGLYNAPIQAGNPDYYLVDNTVRSMKSSFPIFTIRGNEIFDGVGSVPCFYCPNKSDDMDIALALTAISHIGDLRFRHGDADIVSKNFHYGSDRKQVDDNLDYSKVYGELPDPFKNRRTPDRLKNNFNHSAISDSHFKNIQKSRRTPSRKNEISNVSYDQNENIDSINDNNFSATKEYNKINECQMEKDRFDEEKLIYIEKKNKEIIEEYIWYGNDELSKAHRRIDTKNNLNKKSNYLKKENKSKKEYITNFIAFVSFSSMIIIPLLLFSTFGISATFPVLFILIMIFWAMISALDYVAEFKD